MQGVQQACAATETVVRSGLPWGGFVQGRALARTPTEHLDLQPGELVRIKSKEQIEATLNESQLNRGMGFEAEMARYCGRTARVKARVTRCLDERTGELLTMKNLVSCWKTLSAPGSTTPTVRVSSYRSGVKSGSSVFDRG